MTHGHHSYQTSYDISMEKMCAYPPSQHALSHWKFVLCCYDNLPSIYITSKLLYNHYSNIFSTIHFRFCQPIAHCMEDTHWMKGFFSLLFAWSFLCDNRKTIHNKRACYDGDIYFWLPHKFLHSRNKKTRVTPATCMHYCCTSLWKHTTWSI